MQLLSTITSRRWWRARPAWWQTRRQRPGRRLARLLEELSPDAIHVATEGPLGMAAARYCTMRGFKFTTSYHTQFPQYVRKRVPIPECWTYALLRRHHGGARRTLVATEQQRRDLVAHGFTNVVLWDRTELSSIRGVGLKWRMREDHVKPLGRLTTAPPEYMNGIDCGMWLGWPIGSRNRE